MIQCGACRSRDSQVDTGRVQALERCSKRMKRDPEEKPKQYWAAGTGYGTADGSQYTEVLLSCCQPFVIHSKSILSTWLPFSHCCARFGIRSGAWQLRQPVTPSWSSFS